METDRRYDRLVKLSRRYFYNAFETFVWPERLPEDEFWQSPELLSVWGTPAAAEMSQEQLVRLSRFESLNLYSMLVYGERDACQIALRHIHTPVYETPSEYLHHFLEEENKHMWFFSQFCRRYGGKIYPQRVVRLASTEAQDVQDFLFFGQIMVFEEINDYFNVVLQDDVRLPELIRKLNAYHHKDEARHLAMNRILLAERHEVLRATHPPETLTRVERYLKNYARVSFELFYSPTVYRDADVEDPYGLRRMLCANEARHEFHRKVLRRVARFFVDESIFRTEDLYDVPIQS